MDEDDVGEGGVEEHVDHTVALGVRLGQGETHTWTKNNMGAFGAK